MNKKDEKHMKIDEKQKMEKEVEVKENKRNKTKKKVELFNLQLHQILSDRKISTKMGFNTNSMQDGVR